MLPALISTWVIVEDRLSFMILLLSHSNVILSFHPLADCPKMLKLKLTTNAFCGTWYLPHSHVHNE